MTTGLAAVVAKVLAAHRTMVYVPATTYWRCSPCGADLARADVHDASTAWDTHRAHVAAEVTNALTAALTRPEVVEAAVRAVMVLENGSPDPSEREYALAALAAIPEALGAGEVSRG